MHIVISNTSDLPIYVQIKEQVKEQILSGELEEDEMLPSLRQLAKDLKISVLTTTRAYNEWCCTIKVDIENSKGQYIEKDKQEATKDGSESTKIQHGI